MARASGSALRNVRRPLPKALLVFVSAALLIAGLFAGRVVRQEWSVIVAVGVAVLGGAVAFGAVVARLKAFGSNGFAIPVLRARRLLFAAVAAGTGLVLLPVVALQSLEASASMPGSAWQSVVSVDDQADASGLLRQLVPSVGGRVLARLPLLVEGGRVADASSSAIVIAAADGQGDAWIVATTGLGGDQKAAADLGGDVVVSSRLASMHDGGIAIGDRLVLRDPASGRSLQVTVKAVSTFASWSGDVAASSAVLSTLGGLGTPVSYRSAIAVTPAPQAAAKAAVGALAPLATVSVQPANTQGTSLDTAIGSWLRRVALVLLAAAVAVAIALRSRRCRPMRLTLAAAAAGFGWLVAMIVGQSPGLAPVGPFSLGVGLAALCGACAYRLAAIGR